MREILKMIVVLTCIAGISGFALSSLKQMTAPTIELQLLTFVQGPSLKQILPDYTNDPVKERKKFTNPLTSKLVNVFPLKVDGQLKAVAIEGFGGGYGDNIGVMVGFDLENNKLVGIGITTMKETPGIGSRIAEPEFLNIFPGLSEAEAKLKSQGGVIDALSGATISSEGAVVAVQDAGKIYSVLKEEILQAFK
ncbi:RnfABCDGE type electron transport complex subunit G [Halodesulfovibrio sp. MK-HDV]|jgi:H+/Na+-translocating ferredoxin:NAD+ oxidoreductase subunit G|uniref:RnfABCDGE type electron transport complex subunit G n=1 Tax=unclassified Halodesulfovibrio TaxID=2644657 RepID=UPI00136E9F94|nr:FMN-binding protein [Halodesulfovibrio sp. MK-HDV]KAF1076551.1 Electron transport complex subunit RsxG [Halodesulfovibrio sp. MK-HDV]